MLAVRLHRQLLQVGGEALQVLLVGQHGDRLGAEEVAVPDGQQAHQRRQVRAGRRLEEVLVDGVEAGEHLGERARGRSRAWSRARSPSPSSSGRRPTPRSRTCCRCRSRTRATPSALVETATKCLATADSSPPSPASDHSRAVCALVIVSSVVNVFERDDEQRLVGVEVTGRLGEVGAVDVGDEAEGHLAPRVVAQRLVGHHRPEVGAADADVDHVADRLAGVALPLAASGSARRRRPSGRAPRAPA